MIVFFRCFMNVATVWSLFLVVCIATTGIWTKLNRGRHMPAVDLHRVLVNGKIGLFNVTVAVVIAVLVSIAFLPSLDRNTPIVKAHLYFFAPGFAITLSLIKFRFSGTRSEKFHKIFAYPCIVFAIGANILGMYMIP